jgi:transposase InsO family protein
VLLGVSRAGYYAWRGRKESARRQRDRVLLQEIRTVFEESGGTYGSPRVQRALGERGFAVSRRRVERLMSVGGLRARVVRVYRSKPGRRRLFEQHPNRLWKEKARKPGQIWVGDVTYIKVKGRWRFLAVVIDQYSRRLLGWRMGRVRCGELTRAAFDQALRQGLPQAGLIFHSDRGSEYAGTSLRARLHSLRVRQSMTRGGSPADNAHAESFFHSLKAELVHGAEFANDDQLRHSLRRYFRYYNQTRLHSALGYRSPMAVEKAARTQCTRPLRAA